VWKNLAQAAEDIGIDKVIAAVGIDKIADSLDTNTLEKILAKRKRKGKTNA
jgi:hypothetical protein